MYDAQNTWPFSFYRPNSPFFKATYIISENMGAISHINYLYQPLEGLKAMCIGYSYKCSGTSLKPGDAF